jgi:hypothetical protein
MTSKLRIAARGWLAPALSAGMLLCWTTSTAYAQSASTASPSKTSPPAQMTFETPQQAADTVVKAASDYDVPALLRIFGPEGEDFFTSADKVQDKNYAVDFAAKAHEKTVVSVNPKDPSRAVLVVGDEDWPFPVPLVKKGTKWIFDSKAGKDEILYRRIGANELDAIQVCRGYVEAQKEYASAVHDGSGLNQYAQKIFSTPGKHDGLYWKNEDGTPGGPISEAVARAIQEGYEARERTGYHGYFFKILKGQGPAAPMGQLDYVIEGVMIGGFALVAVPAEYRVTGVKTFMVSYDGIVYEKDLGPDSLTLVKNMDRYNPDKTWHPTSDQWPPEDVTATNTP